MDKFDYHDDSLTLIITKKKRKELSMTYNFIWLLNSSVYFLIVSRTQTIRESLYLNLPFVLLSVKN